LFKEIYSYDINLYDLEEALFWKEDELRGKTRKHGILKKRLEDAQLILDDALANLKTFTDSFTQLQVYHDELAEKVESAKVELEEYRQDAEVATVQIKGRYAARFASAMQHFVEEILSGYSQKEADYSKMLEQLMELEREIKQKEEEIVGCKNNILGFEKKRDDAKGTFEEYDSKYQSIQLELDQLKEQIAELNEWK
jgi:chromosome segregation ATPase